MVKKVSKIKDGTRQPHLLVIRLSAMGDVALVVPVLLALGKLYPELKITVLSKAFLAPLFEDLSNVRFKAAAVKSDHKGVGGLYKLFLELRKEGFTAVADLHAVIRSHVLGGFFKASGLKVAQIKKGRKAKKALTRPKNKVFKSLKTTTERYAEVFKALGFPIDFDEKLFLEKRNIPAKVEEFLDKSDKKHIGFAPFAAHLGKSYPLHLAKELVHKLAEQSYKVLLFGGGKEEEQALEKLASSTANCFNLAGKYTFAEELDIISNLDLMIAMDSGNGHLASVYNVPVLTVWGITHPFLGFKAYAQPDEHQLLPDRKQFPLIPTSVYGNKMPEGYEKAIASITPELILNKAKNILLQ